MEFCDRMLWSVDSLLADLGPWDRVVKAMKDEPRISCKPNVIVYVNGL